MAGEFGGRWRVTVYWGLVVAGLCGARDGVTVCPAFLVLSLRDDGIWVFGWSFGGDKRDILGSP